MFIVQRHMGHRIDVICRCTHRPYHQADEHGKTGKQPLLRNVWEQHFNSKDERAAQQSFFSDLIVGTE